MTSRVGMLCDFLKYVIQTASDGGDLSKTVTASSRRIAYESNDSTTRCLVFPLNVTSDIDTRSDEVLREINVAVRVHQWISAATEEDQLTQQDELLYLMEEIEALLVQSAREYESSDSVFVLSSIDSSAAREPMSVDAAESDSVFRAQLELTYYQTDSTTIPDVTEDLTFSTMTIDEFDFLTIDQLDALVIE